VDEYVLAIFTANEAITFGGVEPLDGADKTIFHLSFSYTRFDAWLRANTF